MTCIANISMKMDRKFTHSGLFAEVLEKIIVTRLGQRIVKPDTMWTQTFQFN